MGQVFPAAHYWLAVQPLPLAPPPRPSGLGTVPCGAQTLLNLIKHLLQAQRIPVSLPTKGMKSRVMPVPHFPPHFLEPS